MSAELAKVPAAAHIYTKYKPAVLENAKLLGELRLKLAEIKPEQILI